MFGGGEAYVALEAYDDEAVKCSKAQLFCTDPSIMDGEVEASGLSKFLVLFSFRRLFLPSYLFKGKLKFKAG